jgi:hypothetical protein
VLASVAFLEASINELLASAKHDNLEAGGKLSAAQRDRLAGAAELIEGNNFLDRFQLVLYMLNKTPFNRGAHPYQDTSLLVRLRNELVHYKPQFRQHTAADEHIKGERWHRGLADKHFVLNPFTGTRRLMQVRHERGGESR